jgi:hypothetical protein
MMSHQPKDASHAADSSGDLEERAAVHTTPVVLPPEQKDQEILASAQRLEAELEGLRHHIRTVDEELTRFDTRLSGATTHDQRMSLQEKRKVFEQRRRVLLDREAFLLRKIDSLTRAVEVQRHQESAR